MSLVLFVSQSAWKKIGICTLFLCALFPLVTHAATLGFSPRERTYEVGSTFTVAVSTNSEGASLNAVSGTISFPKDLLEVQSVSKNTSVISLWIQEPTFSNQNGTVAFEGIVLNPGYTGTSGNIVTITFKVRTAGVANLSFPNGSILANDGSGSEILSSRGSAVFTLTSGTVEAGDDIHATVPVRNIPPEQEGGGTLGGPQVQQSDVGMKGWSKETSQTFTFTYAPEVTALRLLLDDALDSIPVVTYEPPIASKMISDLPLGTSYLHVQTKTAEGWSGVTHHKIAIDTSIPETLTVLEQKSQDEHSAVKVFTLQAHDSLSGIDRFEVVLDGAPAGVFTYAPYVTYITPTLVHGTHTLLVRSFDMAGNYIEKTTEFTVTTPAPAEGQIDGGDSPLSVAQFVSSGTALITILSIVVPTIALIVLLCALLLYGLRQYKKHKKHVYTEVLEAQEVTKRVFALIKNDLDDDILILEKASKKRKLTKEEAKLLKHIKQNIEGAQKVIYDEIQDIVE